MPWVWVLVLWVLWVDMRNRVASDGWDGGMGRMAGIHPSAFVFFSFGKDCLQGHVTPLSVPLSLPPPPQLFCIEWYKGGNFI